MTTSDATRTRLDLVPIRVIGRIVGRVQGRVAGRGRLITNTRVTAIIPAVRLQIIILIIVVAAAGTMTRITRRVIDIHHDPHHPCRHHATIARHLLAHDAPHTILIRTVASMLATWLTRPLGQT